LGITRLLRLRRLGSDPRNDLVGLVLGDLREVEHGVTTLSSAKKWGWIPSQVSGEDLVNGSRISHDTSDYATRLSAATVVIDEGVIGGHFIHLLSPGNL
jgi:hypothetical protein